MITSRRNPKIQQIRALQSRAKARREAGAFVVEGVRLAEEALKAGWRPQSALYTEGLSKRGMRLVERLKADGGSVELVTPQVMEAASDTQTPQGLLLVLPMNLPPSPEKLDLALILDELRDPGNLGTILRTAGAAGVDAVWLTPGSSDPWAPKVVRASMGALFQLAIQRLDWAQIREQCQQHELRVFLAAAGEGKAYSEAGLRGPSALIIGGEAYGAGDAAAELADERIHIPMPGEMESLNAAVAAGVLLFEVNRQREQAD